MVSRHKEVCFSLAVSDLTIPLRLVTPARRWTRYTPPLCDMSSDSPWSIYDGAQLTFMFSLRAYAHPAKPLPMLDIRASNPRRNRVKSRARGLPSRVCSEVTASRSTDSDQDQSGRTTQTLMRTSGRPSLRLKSRAWVLVEREDDGIIVSQLQDAVHCWNAQGCMYPLDFERYRNMTHLYLDLDTIDFPDKHAHAKYALQDDAIMSDTSAEDGSDGDDDLVADHFPNSSAEAEIVELCGNVSRSLIALSIRMCKPELVLPYLPRMAYQIAEACPSLQILEIGDIQCEHFKHQEEEDFTYLAAIAKNDEVTAPAAVQLANDVPVSSLRTLTIHKRSLPPRFWKWSPLLHRLSGFANQHASGGCSEDLTCRSSGNGVQSDHVQFVREEARQLAQSIVQHPALRLNEARVLLDGDAVAFATSR
ncbi:hypothetical protein BD413DRAFT_529733 [Trametes elegans]|nr:hypothetical protein BD413DRAFT_529733 [Trametes elegans]